MRLKKSSYFKTKTRNLFWALFNKIENNNNADFSTNGEEFFINSLFNHYKNARITLFDIGANKGFYTKTLLEKANIHRVNCTIHVFEPTSTCINDLKNKFQNSKNVKVNAFGVSDKEGSVDIFYENKGSTLASIYQRNLKQEGVLFNQKETIQLKRLDNYIEQASLSHIEFLKIDTEGHDLHVIKSLGKYLDPDFVDFIQFEYGATCLDANTRLLDFFQLLEAKNFTICKIKKRKLEPRKYEFCSENFNYANYVAVSDKYFNKKLSLSS